MNHARSGPTFNRGNLLQANPHMSLKFLELRQSGYDLLVGTGIEIGGFEHPARLPHADKIIRCDRITQQEAQALFREVDPTRLPVVDVCLDLDTEGLAHFADRSLDFVVCCHVLEHLKNPIKALQEMFRVLKVGRMAALAVPDKNFTFDRQRPLTDLKKLKDIFLRRINVPVPQDYFDVAKYNHPAKMLHLPAPELEKHLERFMSRREHLNIWDSKAFGRFLHETLLWLNVDHEVIYQSTAGQNEFECFVVIKKISRQQAGERYTIV
jgi:SAM-dependent methyltransferase